jgi:4-amino-4-deoxy-L-arabinose transferase-like glycosyltransferase
MIAVPNRRRAAIRVNPRRVAVVRPRERPECSARPGRRAIVGLLLARRDWLIAGLLFLVALWQNLTDVGWTPFHPDETRWLNRAHYVRDLFDPFGSTWDDGYLTRGQPPMGSYLTGLGLLVQGRDLETNGVWDFKYGEEWNRAQGNMSDPADLEAGRRTNAVVGALAIVVLYALVTRLTNRVGGLVAALFLAAHPLMIYLSSQAVSDALMALFVLLSALAAVRLADRPSWPRAILLGVLLGLGGATKLSPILISVPLAGLGAAVLAGSHWSRLSAPLGRMLLTLPLIAFATFVVVYPYLWPDPVGRSLNLIEFRADEMAAQARNWPDVAVESRTDAFRRVGVTLGERFSTSSRLVEKLANGLGREWRPSGIDLLFAIVGGQILLALAVRHGLASRWTLAGVVLGTQAALIVAGMRSDWARYHLPILMVTATCVGVLAGQLWAVAARPAVHGRLRLVLYSALDRLVPDGEVRRGT